MRKRIYMLINNLLIKRMEILEEVYQELLHMPAVPPETGVVLGGNKHTITHLVFDNGMENKNYDIYSPNTFKINVVINGWIQDGIQFWGIAHSHRAISNNLSNGDKMYINEIMKKLHSSVDVLYFPIVIPKETVIWFKAAYVNGKTLIKQTTVKRVNF